MAAFVPPRVTAMKLTLMFREYCSLCHKMREQLKPYQEQFGFELDIVDVDAESGFRRKNTMSWCLFCWMAIPKSAIGFWTKKN